MGSLSLACSHRERRLVIDLTKLEQTYQVQCKTCLTETEPARSGMQAKLWWMRLLREEREAVTA